MTQVATEFCSNCQAPLEGGVLVCPNCGLLRYWQQLDALGRHAAALESSNPLAAANVWKQTLALLPQSSPQFQMVHQRIGTLLSGFATPPTLEYHAQRKPSASLPRSIAITLASMVVSIAVYSLASGWQFATGFVLLILIHEMGHVLANRYYGIKASPPIFIPYVGALINLRQNPPNAKVEAIIGIAGPIAGTLGAAICYVAAYHAPNAGYAYLLFELTRMGIFLNLLNLLPVPPLDGGRVTAALSPWLWMPGLLAMIGLAALDFRAHGLNPIILLLLFYAFPRIWRTLTTQERNAPYYQIGWRASALIGVAYVVLLSILIAGMLTTGGIHF